MTKNEEFMAFFKNASQPNVDLFPYQLDIFDLIEKGKITLIPKSRQMGISNLLLMYAYFKALEEKRDILFVCCNRDMCFSLKNSTFFDKEVISKENRQEIYFKNGSSIRFVHAKKNEIIGIRADILILDEADFFSNEFFEYALPSISSNVKMVACSSLSSTKKTWFKENFLNKENDYQKFVCHYSLNNTFYNKEKIEDLKNILGQTKFDLEIEMGPIINFESKKEKVITFRIDKETKEKMESRLYQISQKEGKIVDISDYIRDLIKKDLKENDAI